MKHALRILIVDDSPDDAALIACELQREFSPSYECVDTAEAMEAALDKGGWHIVISDYVMPDFSGLGALQILQRRGLDLPFIMVSGQMGEDTAVEAMRAGAHDYLLKDQLSRLIPAIKRELNEAVVRRERVSAENALSATEARFQCLVEQSLVGIFMLQDDVFTYVNPKFARIFGYRPEELIETKSLLDLVARDDQIRVAAQFLRPLTERAENLNFSFRGRHCDGSDLELELSGARARLTCCSGVIGTLLDVTGKKKAEAEVSKLWRAVEQSPVSVLITDLQGRIEYVNPKLLEVTGYSQQELIGQTPGMLKSDSMGREFYQELWQTISSGREWHGELHNKKKSGELFWESVSISAVKSAEGRITHFVAVKEDITERKKAIDQMRQVQKMEAVGLLAGGIAHDFNNLLTVINGYSTLIIKALESGAPMRREAEQILRAGERAADLTRQLLSFSRRQILEPRVLDVNRQLKSVEQMLERLIGEHIGLVTRLAADAGFVKMDPGQLEQVVMNLVVNARDASDTGGEIAIETLNCELDDSFILLHPGSVAGSYLRLSVSDRGMGMNEEVKRRLFEPFFTTKELGRGTGLGLATAYGIVKQSGGYIEVISRPGEGSRFNIYLPRVFLPEDPMERQSIEEQLIGSQTILVVEDEPGVLGLVVQILRQRGFKVLETTNPLHGETLFKQHADEIDMLLTDVVMPGLSGPALAERLTLRKPDLQVLFMSGHTQNKVALEKMLENGVQFLPKPFTSDGLIKKVRETLSGKRDKEKSWVPSGGSN
jgi:two-component system cell cycle sensor histidine kinase/response regulator CckA